MYIAEVSSKDVSSLTRILQLLPDDDALKYSNRMLTAIPMLPTNLKRPNRLSQILLPSQDSFTPLCQLHKHLEASIVHALFTLLALEVGVRLNTLVSNNARLSPAQWERVSSLRQLQTLWLEPGTYEKTFLEQASESRYAYKPDGCEACTLSRIAGDLKTLLDLRLVLLSRQSRRMMREQGPPQFTRWVEAWIASLTTRLLQTSIEDFQTIIDQNDADGKALKKVRKQIWHDRKGREKKIRASNSSDGTLLSASMSDLTVADEVTEQGPTDHDAEISIIDHYAALMSTPHLPSFSFSKTSSQHSRISLVSLKTKHPYHQPLKPIPQSPTPSSAYSQSVPNLAASTGDLPELYVSARAGWARPTLEPISVSRPSISTRYAATTGAPANNYRSPHATSAVDQTDIIMSAAWTDASLPRDSYISLVSDARRGQVQSHAPSTAKLAPTPLFGRTEPPLVGRQAAVPSRAAPSNNRRSQVESMSQERIEMMHRSGSVIGTWRENDISVSSTSGRTSYTSQAGESSASSTPTTWTRIIKAAKDGGL